MHLINFLVPLLCPILFKTVNKQKSQFLHSFQYQTSSCTGASLQSISNPQNLIKQDPEICQRAFIKRENLGKTCKDLMTEHTNGPVQVGGFCSCPSQCLIEIGLCKSNFKPYSRSCQLSASVFICEVSHMGFYLFWKAWRLTYQVSLAHITEGGWFSRRSHRHLKILALASSR